MCSIKSGFESDVSDLEAKKKALDKQINAQEKQINSNRQNISYLGAVDAEYKAKKKYLDQAKKSSDISMMYPSYAETSTRGFGKNKAEYVTVPAKKWEEKHVSANEIDSLKKMRVSLEKSMSDFAKSQSGENYKAMIDKIENLEEENINLRNRVRSYENQLNAKTKEYESQLNILKPL